MKVKTVYEVFTEMDVIEVAVHHDLNDDDPFKISIATNVEFDYLDVKGARELIRDLRAAIRLAQEGR